ncbi:sulfatase family protein [Dysosmobacter sp.]
MAKNILLFMTDQQRTEYTGYAPGSVVETPNIDKIAAGAYFTCCNTTNPICTPARTSLITGRYSRQIGTLTMAGDLFPQIPTFMQALQRGGYRTYGIGKYHYNQTFPWSTPRGCGMDPVAGVEDEKQFGFDVVWETAGKQQVVGNYCFYGDYLQKKGLLSKVRDFYQQSGGINGDTPDHNYDQAAPWPFAEEDYVDVVTARVACEQLHRHPKEQPFYMMVSFCGPHKPYDAPQRYLDLFPLEREENFLLPDGQTLTETEKETLYRQRRSAKAMVRLIDDQIGKVLDTLAREGFCEDTLVLFVSDHGDMLGDHYRIQKGVPWRQAMNVPLAIRLPGAAPIGRSDAPVEISDLAATILEYAGMDTAALSRAWPAYHDRIPSRSLLPILEGRTARCRDFCYSESDFTEERVPGQDWEELYAKRGAGGRRKNAWQAIVTERSKYIKYLDYELGQEPYEEFYLTDEDPGETCNCIAQPRCQVLVEEARRRLAYITDHYPAAQLTWCTACAARRGLR